MEKDPTLVRKAKRWQHFQIYVKRMKDDCIAFVQQFLLIRRLAVANRTLLKALVPKSNVKILRFVERSPEQDNFLVVLQVICILINSLLIVLVQRM